VTRVGFSAHRYTDPKTSSVSLSTNSRQERYVGGVAQRLGRRCSEVATFSGISVNPVMSGNSAKGRENSRKRPKVRERSGNFCSQGNLIVAAQQNNLPVLYSYCNSFFICDVRGEFGLRNVHLFDVLPEILSIKVSVWRVVALSLACRLP